MKTVTLSPEFKIAIPREICDSLGLRPGQTMQVICYRGRIELIPTKPVGEMRGFLKGIDTAVEREQNRV